MVVAAAVTRVILGRISSYIMHLLAERSFIHLKGPEGGKEEEKEQYT